MGGDALQAEAVAALSMSESILSISWAESSEELGPRSWAANAAGRGRAKIGAGRAAPASGRTRSMTICRSHWRGTVIAVGLPRSRARSSSTRLDAAASEHKVLDNLRCIRSTGGHPGGMAAATIPPACPLVAGVS